MKNRYKSIYLRGIVVSASSSPVFIRFAYYYSSKMIYLIK